MIYIIIIVYLAILLVIYIIIYAVISLGKFLKLINLNNFILSATCNGPYDNNCLSCYSPSHLYNGICCHYSWQIPKIYNKKYLFFFLVKLVIDILIIIAILVDQVIIDISLHEYVIVMEDIMKFQDNHNV